MDSPLLYLIGLIAVALAFDVLDGLHDAANSIATIVSTRVLPPQYAVFWAAFFNFIAFLFFGLNPNRRNGHNHARYHRRSCNLRRIDVEEAKALKQFICNGACSHNRLAAQMRRCRCTMASKLD
jgi:Phosphate transporter family